MVVYTVDIEAGVSCDSSRPKSFYMDRTRVIMTVHDNPSVMRLEGDGLMLWRAGDLQGTPVEGLEALPPNTVFATPGDATRLVEIEVRPDETRHLAKSLPFLLEDEVVEDIGELVFPRLHLDGTRWLVAIVRHDRMAEWADLLPTGWDGPWVPESLILPWQPDEVCVLIEGEEALVRYAHWGGTRIERSLLGSLLSALPGKSTGIVIYGTDQEGDLALIPEDLRRHVRWRQGALGAALLVTREERLFDLRQGEFAPTLPLARWWGMWRRVAVVAGVAVILQLGADLAAYQRLKAENLGLRMAIQDSFRQANPRGAVVDAEKQLDRQLAEFSPGASGPAFTPMLAAVTLAVSEGQGLDISTLNFSSGSGDMRLELTAEDYAAVEALRQRLDRRGYEAVLETSSSRNDRVRARLRVEERT